ncbi:MAG: thioesterase family protein [Caulobacteraceae bacterium]|nr:thioesterase family protein [Caulobacteraceae bacterium]
MTPFSRLMQGIAADGEAFTAEVSPDWMQGRTTYGGLSGALCVEAARRALPGLPRLRSAQFAFIGPAGGPVRIVPTVLRQGKSSVFVGVDMLGEQGLATRAILTFAAARVSAYEHADAPAPAALPLEDGAPFFGGGGGGPNFSHHFDVRLAGGHALVSRAQPEILIWLKHRDPAAGTGEAALVALGDVAPPAAMAMFHEPAPISTMTWSLDLVEEPEPDAEWFLFASRGEAVADGYSAQAMGLWTASGKPVVLSRQTVALFA